MCALELVSDKASKTPIDKATINNIQKTAYESGAMVRVSGNNIILSPPLIINEDETDIVISALDTGFGSI